MKSNDTLKILNFARRKFDTGILLDDIKEVEVTVLSGDEILDVTLLSGEKMSLDSAELLHDRRFADAYDGNYVVIHDCLKRWNRRKSSYQYDRNSILKLKED